MFLRIVEAAVLCFRDHHVVRVFLRSSHDWNNGRSLHCSSALPRLMICWVEGLFAGKSCLEDNVKPRR